jgi:energy-coupling factor transporter ATP-binding protein EcfA2
MAHYPVILARVRIASLKTMGRGGAVAKVEEVGPNGEAVPGAEYKVLFPEPEGLRPGAYLADLKVVFEDDPKWGDQGRAITYRPLDAADRLEADPETGERRCRWLTTLAELEAQEGEARRGDEVFLGLHRGEFVGIIGPPGDGKSTLLRSAIAAQSRGEPFLGRPTLAGAPAALLDYEGPRQLTRMRLKEAGADPGVLLASPPPRDLADRLLELAALDPQPAAVVIDSFHRYGTRHGVSDFNSVGEVGRLLDPLIYLARAGPLVVVVHHVGKTEGRGAMGSQDFTGAVDELMELRRVTGDPAARELRCTKPRWEAQPPIHYALDAGELRVVEPGGRGLEARVLDYVREHPGCSKTAVKSKVTGGNDEVWAATSALLERGELVTRDGGLHLPTLEGIEP